jgi:hypothetical protein
LATTANRLGGYCILPTASANRLGGGGYLYNRRLAVIDYITCGYITAFEYGFWACFGSILSGFDNFMGRFSADFKIKIQKFLISNKSKLSIKKKKKNPNQNPNTNSNPKHMLVHRIISSATGRSRTSINCTTIRV